VPEGANPGSTVEFQGSAVDGSTNGLAVELNDVLSVLEFVNDVQPTTTVSYSGYPTIGTRSITTIDWSDADNCAQLHQSVLAIENSIIEANISVASSAFTGDNVAITVYVYDGTDVHVNIDLGDGSISVPVCEVEATPSVLTYNVTYQTAGTFKAIVSAYNYVTNITQSQTVDVYFNIRDLTLFGNTTVIVPPGSGTWGVSAGTNTMKDIICVWNMGTNYDDITHSVANSSMPHEMTFTYEEADVGTQTIHVNCSNEMSSQNLTMDVVVVWDNVTLGELTCNSSTLWNHSVICQLTIVRFGTGACFEWDMGDGKPLDYYRDGYCAANVPGESPVYIQVFWTNYVRKVEFL